MFVQPEIANVIMVRGEGGFGSIFLGNKNHPRDAGTQL